MPDAKQQECVLCKVVRKELERRIVYEDEHTIGILETSPKFGKGQCLVFPKKHVDRFYDLDDEDIARLFQGVREVVRKVKKVFQPDLIVTFTQRQQIRHTYVIVCTNSFARQQSSRLNFPPFSRSELDEIADQINKEYLK